MRALRRSLDHSDFWMVPIAAFTTATIVARHPFGPVALATLGGGAIVWTFVEYWVHRTLHDKRFPRLRALHMKHHQNPEAASGGTLYSTAIILGLQAAAIAWPGAASFILGVYLGYFAFILLHHGEHHGWNLALVGDLAKHHDRHHHARPRGCFGVTTAIWDRLFSTL